jgi:dCTP deaminase
MLLSYDALLGLMERGLLMNAEPDQVNGTSIDIRLGTTIMVEERGEAHWVSLADRTPLSMFRVEMNPHGYVLAPGEFVLAQSVEVFNLPRNVSAEYKLKSSLARIGLEHLNAGWCDAGWHGSVLTLELKNMTRNHHIRIRPGDHIGQMVFFQHEEVPLEASYTVRGRYNGDTSVSGVKE